MNKDSLIKKIEERGQKHFFSLTPKIEATNLYLQLKQKKPWLQRWQTFVYPAALGFSFLAIIISSTQPSSVLEHSFQSMKRLNSVAYPSLEARSELRFEDGFNDFSLFKNVTNKIHNDLTHYLPSSSNVIWSPIAVSSMLATLMTMLDTPVRISMQEALQLDDESLFLNQHTSVVIDQYRQLLNSRLALIAQSKLTKGMFLTRDIDASSSLMTSITEDTFTDIFQVPTDPIWQDDYHQWIQQATLNAWSEDEDFPQDLEASSMSLQSLLYYQSNWMYPFLPQHTSNGLFTASSLSQPFLLPMMNKTSSLLRFETDEVEVVVDPLHQGHQMMYILPKGNQTLMDLEMDSILDAYQFNQFSPLTSVNLSLPKMTLQSSLDLTRIMPLMFDSLAFVFEEGHSMLKAPFSSLYIDTWNQTQQFTFNEQGFEVNAVSAPSAESQMMNDVSSFTLNRPFAVIIINEDQMVLLSAMIENPSLKQK
jgi:serine protease inhibitor